ncbi:MAG: outer membrane protein assembly factor BamE [Pseudomonadota bacterium]
MGVLHMVHKRIIAALALAVSTTSACITPSVDFHGYIPDEAQPSAMEVGVDTRASVLAKLGTPSTDSVFDENTWFYISAQRERFAYYLPKVSSRTITAIRFGEEDVVEEVLLYNADDGEVIDYASAETPTLGRQMTLLEQLLGSVGTVALPPTDEITPNNPTGRN